MNVRELSIATVLAAMYAALVFVLAPISFGPIQLRIADFLIPFSAILGWPGIIGVTLGAFIGNAYFFLSPIDVILGSAANLIASYLIFRGRNNLMISCFSASLIIGITVGSYLWMFFPPPSIFDFSLPVWLAMIISITLSSIIAICMIGYSIVRTMQSTKILKTLASKGIKIYD
ncbi:QueT transporter family protein [Candidatus Bathyarchaeota archaeon]|nr:QueT transporter family protein [Candidatus Bathyarchaeota archaeon]